MNRREFIKSAGGGLVAVGASELISGCGGGGGQTHVGGTTGIGGGQSNSGGGPATGGVRGALVLGPENQLVAGTLSAAGSKTAYVGNDKLSGFSVEASSSLPRAISLKISQTPIMSQSFGELVSPVSPLITLDTGGMAVGGHVLIRIPISIDTDQFAMAVAYDEVGRRLYPLRTIEMDSRHLTALTASLESPNGQETGIHSPLRIFVTAMSTGESKSVKGRASIDVNVDTKFVPGIDDWQFENFLTPIAPEGSCLGMCLTSIYHYVNRSSRLGHLNGLYDNTLRSEGPKTPVKSNPDFWLDDYHAIRLCAVAQDRLELVFQLKPKLPQLIEFLNLVLSLKLTGEPALLGISGFAGHAITVYKIKGDLQSADIYVADPTFPGAQRTIRFIAGSFTAYVQRKDGKQATFANFYSESLRYSFFSFVLRELWDQFDRRTIGSADFPPAIVYYLDSFGAQRKVETTLFPDQEFYKHQERAMFVISQPHEYLKFFVDYIELQDNVEVVFDKQYWQYEIKIDPKPQSTLGVAVLRDLTQGVGSDRHLAYVGFRYFNVVAPTGRISANGVSYPIDKYQAWYNDDGTAPGFGGWIAVESDDTSKPFESGITVGIIEQKQANPFPYPLKDGTYVVPAVVDFAIDETHSYFTPTDRKMATATVTISENVSLVSIQLHGSCELQHDYYDSHGEEQFEKFDVPLSGGIPTIRLTNQEELSRRPVTRSPRQLLRSRAPLTPRRY